MSRVTAESERVQAQYRGYFAEPVFAVLGNPANLYSNLLRHLAPFGVKVSNLSINLSVLAQANVSCFLSPTGIVRVWIDHLEVYLPDVSSQKQVEQILTHAFAVMLETDESLLPMRHEATLHAWARLKEEPFSSYIRRFIKAPDDSARWKPSVEFVQVGEGSVPIGSVRLEEATHIPEGLFVRSTVNLGSGAPRADELISAFTDKLGAQLKAVDLDLPLRIE